MIDQYKRSPVAKKKIKDLEADFEKEFRDIKLILPIGAGGTNYQDKYYMDSNSNWFNYTTNQQVTDTATLQKFNNLAQSGAAKATDNDFVLQEPTHTADTPKVNQTAPTPATAPAAPPPGMRTNPARAVKEAIRNAAPGTFSKNAALRNAPTTPAAQPATVPGQPHDLQKDFQGWAEQHVPGLDAAYTLPAAKQKLDAAFQQLVTAQKNPDQQKKAFENFIAIVLSNASLIEKFSTAPENFTRTRKLPFEKLAFFIMKLCKKTLSIELEHFFEDMNCQLNCSVSAFVQQRLKLEPYFFQCWNMVLLNSYYRYYGDKVKRWKGYRIIAADGSNISLVNNPALSKHFGGQSNQQTSFVQAKTFYHYDVLNGLVVFSRIMNYRYGIRIKGCHLISTTIEG